MLHRSQTPSRKSYAVFSGLLLALNLLLMICLAVFVFYFSQSFVDMFSQNNLELPFITRLLVTLPRLIYALCFVLLLILALFKEFRIQDAKQRLKVNLLLGAGLLMLWGLYLLALFLPMFQTIEAIS